MVHRLKTWKEFWCKVESREKNFELRFDDRGYAVGDILELEEYDRDSGSLTGRVVSREVTYILRAGDCDLDIPLTPGWVIMSLK